MATGAPSRFRQRCRLALRRLRFAVLFLTLVLLACLLYLNQVGLPGFLKKPVLNALRQRGVHLEFSRLRWRWDHGLVAENVHCGGLNPSNTPSFAVREVQLRFSYPALARLQFAVDSLVVRNGSLSWPVPAPDAPPLELSVTNIDATLRLLPQDCWQLDQFQARLDGALLELTGTVTNASAIQQWKLFQPGPPQPPGTALRRLRRFADALSKSSFGSVPILRLDVRGDALNPSSFGVRLDVHAPSAETPWGVIRDGTLSGTVVPADDSRPSRATLSLHAAEARTHWVEADSLALQATVASTSSNLTDFHGSLELAAHHLGSQWGGATNALLSAEWTHSLTNPIPTGGHASLTLNGIRTGHGNAAALLFTSDFSPVPSPLNWTNPALGWWPDLAPYALSWQLRLDSLQSPELDLEQLTAEGDWTAPDLRASRLEAKLYGGQLNATALLDVPSRSFRFTADSDFDVQKISGLLTEKSREWLQQFAWSTPPDLHAVGSLVLPEYTNRHPDWHGDVKPTVQLNGKLHIEKGSYRNIAFKAADSQFGYSNEVWTLPDLAVMRPEGRLYMLLESNERTRDYHIRFSSTLDPRAMRPLVPPEHWKFFELAELSQPPWIRGEVHGRWYEPDRIGIKAAVAITNASWRGQAFDDLECDVRYTNRFLVVTEPRIHRDNGAEHLAASQLTVDFDAGKIFLTNGVGSADPLAVARAIGPHIAEHFEPYHFLEPPAVQAEGIIPFRDEREGDLHFTVDGRAFQWWKLSTPRISGRIDWVGEKLMLRDVKADFYGGKGTLDLTVDFPVERPTEYWFNTVISDADLHQLMNDVDSRTNRLEGFLSARLAVTRGEATNWQSLQGDGHVTLRDGLIWQIPVFGILSPVLDSIIPGMGSSRVSEGSATFTLTNGVLYSSDLEVRASIMRLQYSGSVDLQGHVDARADAELLRDAWVVGRLISVALWPVSKLFEYKITGTFRDPKSEPVFFIPKLILLPFHTIGSLKNLATEKPPADGAKPDQ